HTARAAPPSASSTPPRSRSPRPARPPTSSARGARSFPSSSSPSPRRRRSSSPSETSSASSCSSRQSSRSAHSSGRTRCWPPRPRSTASRRSHSEPRPARDPHRPCGLREELQPDRGQQVLVPRTREGAQDADPPGRRAALRRQGGGREHRQGAAEAEAPWLPQGQEARLEEGHRAAPRGRQDRDLRGGRGIAMALRKYKPTSPGRRFRSVSSFEEVTKTAPAKSLLE